MTLFTFDISFADRFKSCKFSHLFRGLVLAFYNPLCIILHCFFEKKIENLKEKYTITSIWRQVLISVWIVKGFIVFIVFLLFQLLKFLLFKVLLFHELKSWENTTICTLDRKPYKVSYFLILWAIINYKMVVINCDRLFEI